MFFFSFFAFLGQKLTRSNLRCAQAAAVEAALENDAPKPVLVIQLLEAPDYLDNFQRAEAKVRQSR